MPLDFNSYRAFQLPVKPPDSPLQIAQDVATLKDTQALSQERQALLQDRQQKLQQEAQDRQEQGQMQAVLAANQGDMEKSYPQLAAINAEKADKYLQAHLQNAELTNKLGEIDTQKQSTVAKYVTDQLTPVQNQHDYDVARAQIQSARALMKLPPASEQDMPAVYDPARVAQMVKNGQMTQDVLGKQQKGSVAFYTLPGDPTPHAMKVTPDGQVLWQGQDVREQAQPWDKGADKPDREKDLVANMTGGLSGTAGLELAQYMKANGITDPLDPRLKGIVNQIQKREAEAKKIVIATPGATPADVKSDIQRTVTGKQYIDLGDYETPKARQEARAAAKDAGVPVVDKATGQSLKAADTARLNINAMWNQIKGKLPKDAQGRILAGPSNKLSAYFQSDADLAAFNSWRAGAIQAVQALVERGMGFRLNQAEINMIMQNDMPQITDDVPTAYRRVKNVITLLNDKENVALSSDRSTLGQPTQQKNPYAK